MPQRTSTEQLVWFLRHRIATVVDEAKKFRITDEASNRRSHEIRSQLEAYKRQIEEKSNELLNPITDWIEMVNDTSRTARMILREYWPGRRQRVKPERSLEGKVRSSEDSLLLRRKEQFSQVPIPAHLVVHCHLPVHSCSRAWSLPTSIAPPPLVIPGFTHPSNPPLFPTDEQRKKAAKVLSHTVNRIRPTVVSFIRTGFTGDFTELTAPEVHLGCDETHSGYELIKERVERILRRRFADWSHQRYDPKTDKWPACFEANGIDYDKRGAQLTTLRPLADPNQGAPAGLLLIASEIYRTLLVPRPPRDILQRFREHGDSASLLNYLKRSCPSIRDRSRIDRALMLRLHRALDRVYALRRRRPSPHALALILTAAAADCHERTVRNWVRVKDGGIIMGRFHTLKP